MKKERKKSTASTSQAAHNGRTIEDGHGDEDNPGDGTFLILKELAGMKAQLDAILRRQAEAEAAVLEALGGSAKAAMPPKIDGPALMPLGFEAKLKGLDTITDEEQHLVQHGHHELREEAAEGKCKKEELLMILQKSEAAKEKEHYAKEMQRQGKYVSYRLKSLDVQGWEIIINTVMGFVIATNAIFIGVAMDLDPADDPKVIFTVLNVLYFLIFLAEFIILLRLRGVREHFTENGKYSNWFDFFLLVCDFFQLLVRVAFPGVNQDMSKAPSASLLRMVRIVKLSRLLRLLRADIFKDLLAMIQGMIGGMSTLAWAMVLFLLIVYVAALLFREFLGDDTKQVENVSPYFKDVPRAMFTTFRCTFGDCSSSGGVPIFEWVHKEYGYAYTLYYTLFMFICVIGLFNVISAIFVESTMLAASTMLATKKKERLRDDLRWAKAIATLVERLLNVIQDQAELAKQADGKRPTICCEDLGIAPGIPFSEAIDKIVEIDVPGDYIDLLVKDPEAIVALEDLDIDPNDNDYLSDIIDPDNGGSVTIVDLIDGLRRLRGDPRRSDIIAVDLMVRSIQKHVDEIVSWKRKQETMWRLQPRDIGDGIQVLEHPFLDADFAIDTE